MIGMTQTDLADLVGLSRTSIVNFEAGRQRLTMDSIVRLSRAIDWEAESLIEGF